MESVAPHEIRGAGLFFAIGVGAAVVVIVLSYWFPSLMGDIADNL